MFSRALLLPLLFLLASPLGGCGDGAPTPKHRERDPGRDAQCAQAGLPAAFFYPAENRTEYRPDDPVKDGCVLLVADHLFCCPAATRPTDR